MRKSAKQVPQRRPFWRQLWVTASVSGERRPAGPRCGVHLSPSSIGGFLLSANTGGDVGESSHNCFVSHCDIQGQQRTSLHVTWRSPPELPGLRCVLRGDSTDVSVRAEEPFYPRDMCILAEAAVIQTKRISLH